MSQDFSSSEETAPQSENENKRCRAVELFLKIVFYVLNFMINTVISLGSICILFIMAVLLMIIFQFIVVVFGVVILVVLFLSMCCAVLYILAPDYTVKLFEES